MYNSGKSSAYLLHDDNLFSKTKGLKRSEAKLQQRAPEDRLSDYDLENPEKEYFYTAGIYQVVYSRAREVTR